MNLFDILGPVMVGPSSSHTAGAARIGYIARMLLKSTPVIAKIGLYGSFATTGTGHGTDKALAAGLLGMRPDDIRIPDSLRLAEEAGLEISYYTAKLKDAHPNTAVLTVYGKDGGGLKMQASSVGGGRIRVDRLDGIDVSFTAERPTLIVHNMDRPGCVAEVTSILSGHSLNVATMQLYRNKRGGDAVMAIETDEAVPEEAVHLLERLEGIIKVTYIDALL